MDYGHNLHRGSGHIKRVGPDERRWRSRTHATSSLTGANDHGTLGPCGLETAQAEGREEMCGRFTLTQDQDAFDERFSFTGPDLGWVPSYNIAPTQQVVAITSEGAQNRAQLMRWGLVPFWAKDPTIGNRMINARAETLGEKPSFRDAFKKRRCLVVGDGFYEWRRDGGRKRPMRITVARREPFAFAGLWESWGKGSGERLVTCTIITTSANDFMEPIYDRMPVILPREAEEAWLDPDSEDVGALSELLLPYPSDQMNAHEVSTLVNSPRNNSPECIAPVASLL